MVSGVASMAASGGDSIRLSLARVKFLSPLMAVLIIAFPDEMLLPKNKRHIRDTFLVGRGPLINAISRNFCTNMVKKSLPGPAEAFCRCSSIVELEINAPPPPVIVVDVVTVVIVMEGNCGLV